MTRTGRPTFRSELDPDTPGPLDDCWCAIGPQSRIGLPAPLTEGLDWAKTSACLLVLEPGGCVSLHDWVNAATVLARRKELIQAIEGDAGAEKALAILADRFRKTLISRRQLKLHRPVLGHLFGNSIKGDGVLLVRFLEHLELWPSRYRDAQFGNLPPELDDLA